MLVGELARRTGVSTATINYYVRIGVLPPPRKTGKTRALYPADFEDRINRIKQLQSEGVPLKLIRRMVNSQPDAGSGFEPPVPDMLSIGRFLEEAGLSDDAYDVLIGSGLLQEPERSSQGELVHSHRDLAAGRAYARLMELGIPDELLLRHLEYEPLARAEAHFLAEHLAAAGDRRPQQEESARQAVAMFDIVRRYLRLRELDDAFPGWLPD